MSDKSFSKCDTFNSTLGQSPFEIETNQMLFVHAVMVASGRVGMLLVGTLIDI